MPDQANATTQDVKPPATPLDDFCKTYQIPMVRELGHIGDGNTRYSEPLCPRIHQIGAKGCICKGEVPEAIETVKSDAGTVAAKGTDAKAATPAAAPKPAI